MLLMRILDNALENLKQWTQARRHELIKTWARRQPHGGTIAGRPKSFKEALADVLKCLKATSGRTSWPRYKELICRVQLSRERQDAQALVTVPGNSVRINGLKEAFHYTKHLETRLPLHSPNQCMVLF